MVKQSIGYIKETEVRQMTVDAVVDTGAWRLVMGEETCKRLGLALYRTARRLLPEARSRRVRLPSWWQSAGKTALPLACPGSRDQTSGGAEEILLGVIPLEDMDLKMNPVDACLEGAYGENWVHYVR
jgi:predicted aspartyl protease